MYSVHIALSAPCFPALQEMAFFFSLMKRNKNQELTNICCKASINLDVQSQAVGKVLLNERFGSTPGIASLSRTCGTVLKASAEDLLVFTAKSSDARLHDFLSRLNQGFRPYFCIRTKYIIKNNTCKVSSRFTSFLLPIQNQVCILLLLVMV